MSDRTVTTPLESARRLVVTKQLLAGRLQARPSREAILSVIRALCYVQLDPISVVAPSHVIVLWSRLGRFRRSDLDRLLWDEKKLFDHWSHASSIVLTEDYPLFYSQMRRYPESLSKSWGGWREKARKFLPAHAALRARILRQLKKGPLRVSDFGDPVRTKKGLDLNWSSGSDVASMLFHLQMRGEVMVVGHHGNEKLWGLPETFLPSWVERKELPEEEVKRQAVQRTIRALGIASPSEINLYFLRGQYHHLRETLKRLREEGTIHRVQVEGLKATEQYIHDRDVDLLASMSSDAWRPRMSLLSPFDNLVSARRKMERLFGFDYAIQIYFPEEKRKFGYYVLPILWGDRFIGRIDPRLDAENERLLIRSVHAEPGAPTDREVVSKIGETIEDFAGFLGAKEVVYPSHVPSAWKNSLRYEA